MRYNLINYFADTLYTGPYIPRNREQSGLTLFHCLSFAPISVQKVKFIRQRLKKVCWEIQHVALSLPDMGTLRGEF